LRASYIRLDESTTPGSYSQRRISQEAPCIDAIVAHDTTRVWSAVPGLVGLIPVYITGNFLFEYMASRVGFVLI
jgi:hypothetical protein